MCNVSDWDGCSKAHTQEQIEVANPKFELGDTLWEDFLNTTIRSTAGNHLAEPTVMSYLHKEGPDNQAPLLADGTIVAITDTMEATCTPHGALNQDKMLEAYTKVQEQYNRIIETVRKAFPPSPHFGLFMKRLLQRPACSEIVEVEVELHLHALAPADPQPHIRQDIGAHPGIPPLPKRG